MHWKLVFTGRVRVERSRAGVGVPAPLARLHGRGPLTLALIGVVSFAPADATARYAEPLPDGSGLLVATWSDGPDVTFSRLDHTGRVVDRFSHSFTRVPVTDRFLEALVDSGVAMAREPYEWAREQGRPVPSDLRAAVEEGFAAPTNFPPVQDMFVAQDGNTWLHLMADGDGDDWLVLGPNGEALWQVRPPGGVRFTTASGSSVWGTWTGDLDVPYVARFEVVAAGQ